MKTLKNLLLSLFVIASIGSMAQNEIKMTTGTVNIGDGKTYYFYDSGGEEEFTVEEDPLNQFRWKTWYQHNETYVLNLVRPQGSTKGIKVTFRTLLINNDHLKIYEGDVVDSNKLIIDLTNNDYSTGYSSFSVMSHGNMTIKFESDYHWTDAGWIAEVKLDDFAPQAPVILRKACDNKMVILPTCKGLSSTVIKYSNNGGTPTNNYTLGNEIDAENLTYPATFTAVAYYDGTAEANTSEICTTSFDSKIAPLSFTSTSNEDYVAYYTYNSADKTNIITINTNRDPNINDTYYARYIINNNTHEDQDTSAASWPTSDYQELVNPGGIIDYTNISTSIQPPFYVHMLIRGTTCPYYKNSSNILTVPVTAIYVPAPTTLKSWLATLFSQTMD